MEPTGPLVHQLHPGWTSDTGPADTRGSSGQGQPTPVFYGTAATARAVGAIGPQPPRWLGLLWMKFSSMVTVVLIGLVLFGVLKNVLG
ncbi:hypothetical protein [Nocardia sp. NPDC049707]|uniref:hypothetical protein n=1 Tax=Nocardia sp. NPDC049707 TaxID=3154735 RepID=UPI00343197F1